MARFLKIICNTLIVLAVAIAVALLLPPIMGITTTIIDNQGIRSNLPVGSVTYSRKIAADNLKKDDLVLVETKNEAYEYTVVSVDVVTNKMVVRNAFDSKAKEKELKITSGVSRVSFTIPLIGFAVVAMQSVEGMIVIGLIVLFIIILYILSEVWKKKPEEEEMPAPRKEKTRKDKGSSSNLTNVSSGAPKEASVKSGNADVAVMAAGVVAGGTAAAAFGQKASEAAKDEKSAAEGTDSAGTELSEEEFQRILAEAMAKNGTDMEVGLDGWQPAEAEPPRTAEGTQTAGAAEGTENAVEALIAATSATATSKTEVSEEPAPEESKTERALETAKDEGAKSEEPFAVPKAEQDEGAAEDSGKKKRVPPRRRTLDEMLEYAKKGGGDPEFRKDDVSGLDVVDYSSFL